jgi:hypothetical protein
MSTLFQSVYTLSLFAYARERERGEKKGDPENFSPMIKEKKFQILTARNWGALSIASKHNFYTERVTHSKESINITILSPL